MCDERVWRDMPLALLSQAVHADLSLDDNIPALAGRTLAVTDGMLIPIGLSMGGIVALEMARQAPERIAGMVLSDTNAGADLAERAAARPAQQERVRAGELETLVRYELPITLVVIRNSVYGWIKAGQKTGYGGRYFSVDFGATDHAKVAEAYGVKRDRKSVV